MVQGDAAVDKGPWLGRIVDSDSASIVGDGSGQTLDGDGGRHRL